jgi:hypothetical protein
VKTFAILLDTRPRYLEGATAATSLLLAPLGASTMLRYLSECLTSVGHPRLSIATDFAPDPDYQRQVARSGVSVSRSCRRTSCRRASRSTSRRIG